MRVKLTLSYLALLLVTECLLLAVVWLFLLRYVPSEAVVASEGFFPGQRDLIRAFFPAALWAMIASLVFGAIGAWLLAGRMLAPLDRIAVATRQAARGSLSHRIRLEGRNDEFRELADSFDRMLSELESQVEAQRRFAANASHELRTPLALTQAMLEVAERDPELDEAKLRARLRGVNDRAIALTEALLTLSRADSASFSHETVDLALAAEEAVETLLPLAERSGIELDLGIDDAVAMGSFSLLQQLILNLLHNAIVHNVEAGGFVRLRVGVFDGDAVVAVENSGPAVSREQIETLTEPFLRGTERVHASQAGAGLGLAIAQSIVRAHSGELRLEARAQGGLLVTVVLPLHR